jgi:NADPH:quinone reductase-like Zn-dependent oxidoreductase
MQAIQISEYGTNEVVKLIDTAVPTPGENEVLVKVHTAGINPIDWKIRAGAGARLGLTLPIMLGGEIVGRIEKVGSAVSTFKAGDIIYGMVKTGAFAEYAVAKESDIVLKPKDLTDQQAAAIPLAGLTAWQSLFDLANLSEGQRILITGASGAVGSLAVQFAKSTAAYVIGTASAKNEAFVRGIGADEFINYEAQNFQDLVREIDVVFDTVGGETFESSFLTVKKGGIVVSSVAFPNDELSKKFGIENKRVFCKPESAQLTQISRWFEGGKLKARVAQVFPLARIKDALALSESGRANGKIVLQIND